MQLSAFAAASVTLAWSPSSDPIVAGYNMYYGGASGSYTNEIPVGSATSVTVTGLVQGATYYFAATTYSDAGVESSLSSEVSYTVPGAVGNTQPTLDAINNVSVNENAGLQTVNLSGITSGSASENQTLIVSAISSNPGLIPNPTATYTSANTTGFLSFTPVANGNGTATITVTVNDGGANNNTVTQTFTVTVSAVNNQPTLNALSNVNINENAGLQSVNLSGITSGAANENQTLAVSAISSNPGLIPNPVATYSSANTTGSLSFTPVANGNGSATITVTVNDGGTSNNIVTRTFTVTVSPVNNPPTLNAISNVNINENAGLQAVNLSGITSGAANENQSLAVSAISSNPGLIPNPVASYTSANTTGSLGFTPAANGTGSAIITVTVNDGGTSNNIVTRLFTITVNAVSIGSPNQPPTLDPIGDLDIDENAGLQQVDLTGITSGSASENQTLTVTAISSNPGLIPNPAASYTNADTTGSLSFTPVANGTGSAIITVTVNDGGTSNNIVTQTFTVTVDPVGPTNLPPGSVTSLPALDPINDLVVDVGAKAQLIPLTGISSGSTDKKVVLKIKATSSDLTLTTKPQIKHARFDSTGRLIIKPRNRKNTGTSTITVTAYTVYRGHIQNNAVTRTFHITILPAGSSNLVAAVTSANNSGSTSIKPVASSPAAATLQSAGYAKGRYTFTVSSASGNTPSVAGKPYVVEASTDLVHWIPVQTNTAPFTFVDANANRFGQRFYRAVPAP